MAMILDSFVGLLSEKLATLIEEEVVILFGVKEELVKLQRKLPLIQSVLEDAEKKAFHDPAILHWTARLKDVMYDADDVLDEFRTKQLLQQTSMVKAVVQECDAHLTMINPFDVHKAHGGESEKFFTRSIC